MTQAELLFLGTGASSGVPMIGCHCPVCHSLNPKNRRLRPSAMMSIGKKRILIDVGPDFRQQALSFGIDDMDGVILTHTHFDHVGGLDELRSYFLLTRKRFPLLVSEASLNDIKVRFSYLFETISTRRSLAAQLDFHLLPGKKGKTDFLGIPIGFTTYFQGGMEVNGYRFGNLSYITDIRDYEDSIFEELKGTEILVLSALRKVKSPVHFDIEEATQFAAKVKAKKTYLIHLSHEVDYEVVSKELPDGIFLAYDGLRLDFSIGIG